MTAFGHWPTGANCVPLSAGLSPCPLRVRAPATDAMTRFLLRLIGFLTLAAAFIALVLDGTKSIAGNRIVFTPLGQTWTDIHSTSLQLLQAGVTRHVSEWLWDPVLLNILTSPTWLVVGVFGAVLLLLGRKRKRLIGYARD
jgi:hypothetical protein